MGFLSHKLNPADAEPGDHVYVHRAGITYAHHGILVVGGTDPMVVHLSPEKGPSCSSSSSSSSSSTHGCGCGYRNGGSAVVLTCLGCFTKGGILRRFEYGVSTAAFLAKIKPGTCSTATSDPPEGVIRRAEYLLSNGFGDYDLFTNNCEIFALYCKTGLIICGPAGCGQAVSAAATPLVALSSAGYGFIGTTVMLALEAPLLMAAPVVGVFALGGAAVWHNALRYKHDFGTRVDTIKVRVEGLHKFRRLTETAD